MGKDVPATGAMISLVLSVSKHLLLVGSSLASFISDTGKANVTCGLKVLKVERRDGQRKQKRN